MGCYNTAEYFSQAQYTLKQKEITNIEENPAKKKNHAKLRNEDDTWKITEYCLFYWERKTTSRNTLKSEKKGPRSYVNWRENREHLRAKKGNGTLVWFGNTKCGNISVNSRVKGVSAFSVRVFVCACVFGQCPRIRLDQFVPLVIGVSGRTPSPCRILPEPERWCSRRARRRPSRLRWNWAACPPPPTVAGTWPPRCCSRRSRMEPRRLDTPFFASSAAPNSSLKRAKGGLFCYLSFLSKLKDYCTGFRLLSKVPEALRDTIDANTTSAFFRILLRKVIGGYSTFPLQLAPNWALFTTIFGKPSSGVMLGEHGVRSATQVARTR